jgi:hypothetical protein
MSKNRKRLKQKDSQEPESKQQIALATKQKLILTITILIAILAVLLFKVGGVWWPVWLVESQKALIAILVFLVIFFTLLSPIIIAFTSEPRPLSGPGKNPKTELWKD